MLVGRTREEAEERAAGLNAVASTCLLVVFVLELRRVAEPQNLTARVARQNAVRAFGFEGNDRDVPGTRTIGRRHAAARQAFERFELEHRRRRLHWAL